MDSKVGAYDKVVMLSMEDHYSMGSFITYNNIINCEYKH